MRASSAVRRVTGLVNAATVVAAVVEAAAAVVVQDPDRDQDPAEDQDRDPEIAEDTLAADLAIVADPDLVTAKIDLALLLVMKRERSLAIDLATDLLLSVNVTDLAPDPLTDPTDVNQSRKPTAMITVRLTPPLMIKSKA
eukprot:TRINITY_DN436_c0_g1_i1.p2 TRINITY_DN436_c0_g1~~TRINITY_DN436_c0_g1_i1.p2  ORF type:complete len:140 (-),score=26.01 TRINITY_DN436_c0_g1_i1:116-535(-)